MIRMPSWLRSQWVREGGAIYSLHFGASDNPATCVRVAGAAPDNPHTAQITLMHIDERYGTGEAWVKDGKGVRA